MRKLLPAFCQILVLELPLVSLLNLRALKSDWPGAELGDLLHLMMTSALPTFLECLLYRASYMASSPGMSLIWLVTMQGFYTICTYRKHATCICSSVCIGCWCSYSIWLWNSLCWMRYCFFTAIFEFFFRVFLFSASAYHLLLPLHLLLSLLLPLCLCLLPCQLLLLLLHLQLHLPLYL